MDDTTTTGAGEDVRRRPSQLPWRLALAAAGVACVLALPTMWGSFTWILVGGALVVVATAGLDGVHPARHLLGHAVSFVGVVLGVTAQVLALIEHGAEWADFWGTTGTSVGGALVAAAGILACRAIKGKRLRTWWLLVAAGLPLLYVLG